MSLFLHPAVFFVIEIEWRVVPNRLFLTILPVWSSLFLSSLNFCKLVVSYNSPVPFIFENCMNQKTSLKLTDFCRGGHHGTHSIRAEGGQVGCYTG